MGTELRVTLTDLRRAFRRLLTRLPDEFKAGSEFNVFSASADQLSIVAGGTSEVLKASVAHPCEARIPHPVFCGIARTLRFYRGRAFTVACSKGVLKIGRTEFGHPGISVPFDTVSDGR